MSFSSFSYTDSYKDVPL